MNIIELIKSRLSQTRLFLKKLMTCNCFALRSEGIKRRISWRPISVVSRCSRVDFVGRRLSSWNWLLIKWFVSVGISLRNSGRRLSSYCTRLIVCWLSCRRCAFWIGLLTSRALSSFLRACLFRVRNWFGCPVEVGRTSSRKSCVIRG